MDSLSFLFQFQLISTDNHNKTPIFSFLIGTCLSRFDLLARSHWSVLAFLFFQVTPSGVIEKKMLWFDKRRLLNPALYKRLEPIPIFL